MRRWVRSPFGRRGAFLLLFGAMWALAGYGRLSTVPSEQQLTGIQPLLAIAPYRTWAALWLVTGIAALVAAFLRKPGQDVFGFVALVIPVSLWGISNLVLYSVAGYRPGLQAAAIFACMLTALIIVAGWPEPRR